MIDTPCAAHAAQNSFKWALWKDEYTAEELKDAHILVEALRRSSNLFFGAVGDWVTKRMAFKPDLETDDIDASRLLWDALGVDPEVAETLSQLLQLKYNFATEQLEVAESAREMPGLVNNIVNTLMAIWEFKTFTTSRFLSIGTSGRVQVAGELTGLRSLVQQLRRTPGVSLWHLNGFSRFEGQPKKFLTEASLVSRPMDAALCLLMEDSRVAFIYERLHEAVYEELEWLAQLPNIVWDKLSVLAETTPTDFRSRCLKAAHESVVQFESRVLQIAAARPWSLCRGDKEANVEELLAEEEPLEPFCRSLWILHKVFNVTVHVLVKLVVLLENCPWTTLPTEQFHASAANLMKYHPEYTRRTLRCRAILILFNRLIARPSHEEKAIARLEKKLDWLVRKQPEKATGRHLYARDLMKLQKDHMAGAQFGAAKWQHRLFQRHGAFWAAHPLEMKLTYAARAQAYHEAIANYIMPAPQKAFTYIY